MIGRRPPTDFVYARQLTQAAESWITQADPGGLRVVCSGGYAIAAASERSIRHDAISSIIGSVLLLLLLFCLVFRRGFGLFHLAFAPVALGTLWGFGAYGWSVGGISPIAAVIGGVLAGMGIDYSVLILTRYLSIRSGTDDRRQALAQTLTEIGGGLFAAWITSVAGFLATGFSTVKALRDFSIVGTLGLTGSFLAAVFVLPAILQLLPHAKGRIPPSPRLPAQRLLEFLQRRRRACLTISGMFLLTCLIVSALSGNRLFRPESDLTVMHPRPNPPLDAEAEITRRFGAGPGDILIVLDADDSTKLLTLAHEVHRRLTSPQALAGGIAGTYGIETWLPDPAVVAARRAAMTPEMPDRVVADLHRALADSMFNPESFSGYESFLRRALSAPPAPNLATLQKYPGLARSLLPAERASEASAVEREAVSLVFLTHQPQDRASRDAAINAARSALAGLDGVTLTGVAVVGHDAENAVFTELPRLLLIACLLVAGYLLIHFRSPRDMALSLLPGLFGLAGLAALIGLAGVRLNTANLVALPLLIGIDVDYGIYLVTLARRREAIASAAHAVLVCAASMVAGYGSLVFTSVPAIRSLGVVVAGGVIACVAGAMFCLVPILLGSEDRHE